MLDKEKQYSAIYFPEAMLNAKELAYWALLDIDSNFSKLIQSLLPQIKTLGDFIKEREKNYRHFDWILAIKDPETGTIITGEQKDGKKRIKTE